MQVHRLKMFDLGLERQFYGHPSILSSEVYFISEGKWFDLQRGEVNKSLTLQSLSFSLESGQHHRRQKSNISWFPLVGDGLVVSLVSSSPPKTSTRDALQEIILQCWKHARDAYDASHDRLTGILNAKSIEEHALECLISSVNEGVSSDAVQLQASQKIVALISLDIDHFKQINDSHGHDYGDVVLMVFSRRVENALEQIRQKQPAISLQFGRSGGEEFSIVASGKFTEETLLEMADEIRASIGGRPLPDESEWAGLPLDFQNSSISLPHVADRKVTSSVGVSSLITPTKNSNSRKLSEKLRREADAALYRAKAGGRNVVRNFPSIRDKYGSVLEHHADTGIVAIDIGKEYDVQVGHEFSVYHPDFTGDRYFVRSDGRSKKTLGVYPRVSCGRLVVFDSQRDIAFCSVEEKSNVNFFPVGSSLSFIPAGSIKHLISAGIDKGAAISPRMTSPQAFEASIKNAASGDLGFSVATLSLLNSSSLENSHGVSTTNKALADLFRSIEMTVPVSSKISQIGPFDISFLVFDWDQEELRQKVEIIMEEAESRSMGLGEIVCGIYLKSDGEIEYLDGANGLDFSRFAASPLLRSQSSKIEFFSESTATSLINAHRMLRRQTDGQQDYMRLQRLGLKGASFHNQGALCYLESFPQDLNEASLAIERALQGGDDAIFHANRGTIRFVLNDFVEAEASFARIREISGFVIPEIYKPLMAMSAYYSYREGMSLTAAGVLGILEEAANLKPEFYIEVTQENIGVAIEDLEIEIRNGLV